jgi:hypothetical protein
MMNSAWKASLLVAVLLLAGGVISTHLISQEKTAAQPQEEGDWMDMMAQWQEMNSLGKEHERFKKMVGTWDVNSKMWFAPGMEPVESKGSSEIRLILGGRYIEQKYECPMMGMPYQGLGFEGYDKIKKKYVSIWMDSMGTGIFYSEGTADETGKVFTYIGKADDPFTGEKDKPMKSVGREINDDKVVFEMYETRPGVGEYKSMELTYTRRK